MALLYPTKGYQFWYLYQYWANTSIFLHLVQPGGMYNKVARQLEAG